MQHTFQGLMLGCALMLALPAGPGVAQHMRHAGMAIVAAVTIVEWRDIRIALVCSESNPAARVCLRSYEPPLRRR